MNVRQTRNRTAVVATASLGPPVTRAGVARMTGLSAATVSALVTDLLADGTLLELEDRVPSSGSAGGRPSAALTVNPALGMLIGIHLGHGGVRIVLTTLDGTVQAEHSHQTDVDHHPADTLEYVASTALDMVAEMDIPYRKLRAVGVAVSAPVVLHSQTLSAPKLSDWGEVDIPARLRRRMGLPVHVGNDANLGALAEWQVGAAVGVDNLLYVMLSEGVGAGLILHGRLYEGATGAAGELGHVTVDRDGQVCRCGSRGCLETIVGQRALAGTLSYSRGPGGRLADVLRLAGQGDAGARRLLDDAGRAVGSALAGACTMLNPDLIVVGGALAHTGESVLDGIRDSLTRSMSAVSNGPPRVVRGALGCLAEAQGAVMIARQATLANA